MESGIDNKKNILILSSFLSKDGSSKMIKDICRSLGNDYFVDVLTKYPLDIDDLTVYSAFNKYEALFHSGIRFLKRQLTYFSNFLIKPKESNALPYYFFGLNEEKPPVNPKRILNKIEKNYDFILVFFWQGLLNSVSLNQIYLQYKTPLLLVAADMYPMTGGCSYFWDCNRLEVGCGNCPGLQSSPLVDRTDKNMILKREMLSQINCIFLGNTWQNSHANKSKLFKKIGLVYPIVDELVFKPRDKGILKSQHNFSNKKILFFGSLGVNDPRKGAGQLVNSLQLLLAKRPDLVENLMLVIAGTGDKITGLEGFSTHYTGYLDFGKLAEFYALADVFLSPSIEDAGPMMLNQALMCGTPSVAFAIGTACDVLNPNTGYLARYADCNDFSDGIIHLLTRSDDELKIMQEFCRNESLQRSSYEGFRKYILKGYDSLNQNKD